MFRCLIEKSLLRKAICVAKRLGTSNPELVRRFIAHLTQTESMPPSLGSGKSDSVASPWSQWAEMVETFYGKSKLW